MQEDHTGSWPTLLNSRMPQKEPWPHSAKNWCSIWSKLFSFPWFREHPAPCCLEPSGTIYFTWEWESPLTGSRSKQKHKNIKHEKTWKNNLLEAVEGPAKASLACQCQVKGYAAMHQDISKPNQNFSDILTNPTKRRGDSKTAPLRWPLRVTICSWLLEARQVALPKSPYSSFHMTCVECVKCFSSFLFCIFYHLLWHSMVVYGCVTWIISDASRTCSVNVNSCRPKPALQARQQ